MPIVLIAINALLITLGIGTHKLVNTLSNNAPLAHFIMYGTQNVNFAHCILRIVLFAQIFLNVLNALIVNLLWLMGSNTLFIFYIV